MPKKHYSIHDFPVKIQNVLNEFRFSGKWSKGDRMDGRSWLEIAIQENLLNTPELQIELVAFLLSSAKRE